MNLPYVYDAGALTAIDSGDRSMWRTHQEALDEGRDIVVPAIVVGQVWRDSRRQVQLGWVLRSCDIEPTGLETAKAAGVLCGQAGTSDVVDATVMVTAIARHAIIVTSDFDDMTKLAEACGARPTPVVLRV